MIFLRNRLASYEVYVADYYLKRGAYVGAINRCEVRDRELRRRAADHARAGDHGRSRIASSACRTSPRTRNEC